MFNDFLYNDALFNDIISLEKDYSRGSYSTLPLDDTDLLIPYSDQDYIDVSTIDGVRVLQGDSGKYVIHQFKDIVTSYDMCKIEWYGRSTLTPAISIVFLQIYNINTSAWETIASNGTALQDQDFTLTADLTSLSNYKGPNGAISCRVYQFIG